MSRLSVTDIPPELWLDNVLPNLPLSDVLRLGCTNRFFYLLTSDEPFWHRKLQKDYNFSGSDTARATGWKFIYKRVRNPQVYVWGETGHGRLGLSDLPSRTAGMGVPSPTRLHIPGVKIVNLVAGGMSFHALDVEGNVYVWGVLDGTSFVLSTDGFSLGGKKAEGPMRLALPVSIRTLSCGRLHTAALDSDSIIWTFTTWGRPFRLLSPLLDRTSPESMPIQVECGWSFTAILTQAGDVLVYWPYGDEMRAVIEDVFRDLDAHDPSSKAIPLQHTPRVIPCHPWDLTTVDPVRLWPIPHNLPLIPTTGLDDESNSVETKLIKIAGMDNNIIGLTNKGHVLKYNRLSSEANAQQGEWEYLPYFSEAEKVAEDEVFSRQSEDGLTAPQAMHITHISAHFKTFVAYSAGPQAVVLMGNFSTEGDPTPISRAPLKPIIHRNLQYQSVISVVFGDYHYGALTATGKLFTWGAYSKGALGLGNPMYILLGQPGGFLNEQHRRAVQDRGGWMVATPPDVQEPTEVKIDRGEKPQREKFYFAVTAAGWHMGALVIDVDPDEDVDVDDTDDDVADQSMPGSFPSRTQAPATEGSHHPAPIFQRGGLPYFRVGFAGRGAFRGRGGFGRAMDPN